MSYDIYVVDNNGDVVHVDQPHQIAGGTFALGGTTELWVNVTYNYSDIIDRVLEGGWKSIHKKRVDETLNDLARAINQLAHDNEPDYWKATEGNARRALLSVLGLGLMHLDGFWRVS